VGAPKGKDGRLDHNKAMTGDDLRDFVNGKLFPLPDGRVCWRSRTGVRHAAIARFALLLCASDSLVLEHPDDDSSVLCLTLSRLIIANLPAFAHRSGR
jgi:hypothetical protein